MNRSSSMELQKTTMCLADILSIKQNKLQTSNPNPKRTTPPFSTPEPQKSNEGMRNIPPSRSSLFAFKNGEKALYKAVNPIKEMKHIKMV